MRKIVIHRTEPDEAVAYWVECPSLGIASQGDTIDEAVRMIREAITLHIEDLIENGDPVPPPDSDQVPEEQQLVLDA